MKIISWNVNGIRAWLQKENVPEFLEKENPDVFCIQESKAQPEQVEEFVKKNKIKFFENHQYLFWNSAERKGYSGTAIFSKIKPLSEQYGIGHKLDNEGRVITLEFSEFFLVTVYTPNSKADLSRLETRYQEWDKLFLKHLKKLEKKKSVVVCGDLNVAHQEIDLKNPQANKTTKTKPGNAGFTDQERERFGDYLQAGLVDIWRERNPGKIKYSWWSYRFNARKNNSGWRIDYFLISEILQAKIKTVKIFDQVLGSDHCPVGIEIF